MQFSIVIMAFTALAAAAAVERRETCSEVTDKLNACLDACPGSDWTCDLNWLVSRLSSLILKGAYH